jgi:hypothetical protein
LHNASGSKNGASANGDCLCDAEGPENKNGAMLHNGRASTDGDEPERPPVDEFVRLVPAG